jgi:hypothetical protein
MKLEDLEAGLLTSPWALRARHQAVPADQFSHFSNMILIGILLSSTKGAWDSTDEMNQLFPDHKFEDMETFLTKIWH